MRTGSLIVSALAKKPEVCSNESPVLFNQRGPAHWIFFDPQVKLGDIKVHRPVTFQPPDTFLNPQVKLGDINDNDPIFDSAIEAHVTENSPKGTAVIPPGIISLSICFCFYPCLVPHIKRSLS